MPDQGGIRSDNSAGVNFFGFAVPKAGKNAAAAEKFVLYFMNKDQLAAISTEAGNMTPRTDIPAPPGSGLGADGARPPARCSRTRTS